jgi:hypothetical protein
MARPPPLPAPILRSTTIPNCGYRVDLRVIVGKVRPLRAAPPGHIHKSSSLPRPFVINFAMTLRGADSDIELVATPDRS